MGSGQVRTISSNAGVNRVHPSSTSRERRSHCEVYSSGPSLVSEVTLICQNSETSLFVETAKFVTALESRLGILIEAKVSLLRLIQIGRD